MFYRYFAITLVAIFTFPIFLGCGPNRPETADATGKITFQGKPVPEGNIVFYPEKGRSASGKIQSDGTYTLTTFDEGDGAILGNHTVTIEAVRFAQGSQPKSFEEELAMAQNANRQPSKPQWLVPQKYANRATSGLTATVKSGSNAINFDLPN